MLDPSIPIIPLKTTRALNMKSKLKSLYSNSLLSSWMIGKVVMGLIFSKPLSFKVVNIGSRFIQKEKTAFQKTAKPGEYITTNDIVSSWFFKASRSTIVMMAMNLRGRVKEFGSEISIL